MICKICHQEILERSHFWKIHKIKESNYYEKYLPKTDLFDKSAIIFKSPEQYELADFNNRTNLRKYIESVSKDESLYYLQGWLYRRKQIKNLSSAPTEFELKSLPFPSLKYWDRIYRIDSYKRICKELDLTLRCSYDYEPSFIKNIDNQDFICDTREQNILKLPNMQIATLKFGDYTMANSNIFIERKSLADFIGTLSAGYERFEREIIRCKEANNILIILIEEPYTNVAGFEYKPHIRAQCDWTFISHRFRELLQRYPLTIQFLAVDGRKESVRVIEQLFKTEVDLMSLDLQYLYDKGAL